MQIEKTIPLYANESVFLFKKANVGKKNPKSMLESCIQKISLLLSAARKEQIYPLCYLVTIKQKMHAAQQTILSGIEEYSVLLETQNVKIHHFSFTPIDTIEVMFGNPVVYQLIQLVEQFDYLFRLLSLARNTSLLVGDHYFQKKDFYVKQLQTIFMDIFHQKLNFPSVTIEDYLHDKSEGEVDLSMLHLALKLNFLPYLEKEKINHYQALIKEKIQSTSKDSATFATMK